MDSAQTNRPVDGRALLGGLKAAAEWFAANVPAINALNVFPVPDGDTGTNMNLTLQAALKDVQEDASVAVVAERVYRGALMGARGNSGVILSQILRGLSQGFASHATITPLEFVAALEQAAATAYKAVIKPVEGTMLTVIRETSEQLRASFSSTATMSWEEVLKAATDHARASVDGTPKYMKLLRDAGVVDAGGEGLFVLLQGALAFVRGEALNVQTVHPAQAMAFDDVHSDDDFGYCTNFMIEGEAIPYEEVRATLADMGTSVVAVGDERLVKVHIHMLRPGDALNYAMQWGSLSAIEITNMDNQRRDLHAADQAGGPLIDKGTEPVSDVGVVAVAPGEGFSRIFRSLNVGSVITGGQTMNPSIQDLVEAIESLPQQVVVVLPNNSNVILAAQQASQLTTKTIHVVPTKTVPQGMAAMFAFNYAHGIDENVTAMKRALDSVSTAEITTAVRDATINDIDVRIGQTIGLLDGTLVESGDDRDAVIRDTLARMELDDHEIVTIYYGEGASEEQAQQLADQITSTYPDIDVEVQSGGQPFYDYILSAE